MRRTLLFVGLVLALSAPAIADPVLARATAAEQEAPTENSDISPGELKARCESGGGCVVVLGREFDQLLAANKSAARAIRIWYDRAKELQRQLDEKNKPGAGCS